MPFDAVNTRVPPGSFRMWDSPRNSPCARAVCRVFPWWAHSIMCVGGPRNFSVGERQQKDNKPGIRGELCSGCVWWWVYNRRERLFWARGITEHSEAERLRSRGTRSRGKSSLPKSSSVFLTRNPGKYLLDSPTLEFLLCIPCIKYRWNFRYK